MYAFGKGRARVHSDCGEFCFAVVEKTFVSEIMDLKDLGKAALISVVLPCAYGSVDYPVN